MSQQEPNRKWMPLIIGLILVLLIAGISFGTGSGALVSQFQKGSSIVHFNTGDTVQSVTVVFPTEFTIVPSVIAQVQTSNIGFALGEPQLVADTICFICSTNGIASPSISFIGTNQTLFGTSDYVATTSGSSLGQGLSQMYLTANIATTSCASDDKILVQVSFDGGSTWADLEKNTTGQLALSATGITTTVVAVPTIFTVPIQTSYILRILFIGSTICSVTFYSIFVTLWNFIIGFYTAFVQPTAITKTQVIIKVRTAAPTASSTGININLFWQATVP